MNAIELFHQDGKSAGVFYCAACRIVKRTKSEAEECCSPVKCKDCGNVVEIKYTFRPISVQCDSCSRDERARIEQKRFDKAEKLTKWDGPVYCEGHGRNGYAKSVSEMLDYLEDVEERPKYVWACTIKHFVNADISDITERLADDAYEDFDPDDLNGLEELNVAIKAFNEANQGAVSWEPDFSKAIPLDGREWNEFPEMKGEKP